MGPINYFFLFLRNQMKSNNSLVLFSFALVFICLQFDLVSASGRIIEYHAPNPEFTAPYQTTALLNCSVCVAALQFQPLANPLLYDLASRIRFATTTAESCSAASKSEPLQNFACVVSLSQNSVRIYAQQNEGKTATSICKATTFLPTPCVGA
jgi:hypothetical protein